MKQFAPFTLLVGHVLDQLAQIPSDSVHCIVTSPPYWGLRDYKTEPQVWGGDPQCTHAWEPHTRRHERHGQQDLESSQLEGSTNQSQTRLGAIVSLYCTKCQAWKGHYGLEPTLDEYIEHTIDICRELRRVLRPDGTLWLNLGDCYCTNGGSGVVGKTSARADRTYQQTNHRVVNQTEGIKYKDMVGVPWAVAFALRADGWWLRRDIIWDKPNAMPESTRDRPATSHEYIFLLTKSEQYFFDQEAVKEPASPRTHARTAKGPKTAILLRSKSPKSAQHGSGIRTNESFQAATKGHVYSVNPRSVWRISTQPCKDAHFATFPVEIPRRCIKAGTSEKGCCPACGAPQQRIVERQPAGSWNDHEDDLVQGQRSTKGLAGDDFRKNYVPPKTIGWKPTCECQDAGAPVPCTVLDPFIGTGRTALAALLLDRHVIGIELHPDHADMTRRNVAHALSQHVLFEEETPEPEETSEQPTLFESEPAS